MKQGLHPFKAKLISQLSLFKYHFLTFNNEQITKSLIR